MPKALFLLRQNRDLPVKLATSTVGAVRERDTFRDVKTYCMFIGYPRSGHSLIGSLLDAHPNVVISHELDALRFLRLRFTKNQIYSMILAKSRADAARKRPSNTYTYAVEGQYQGTFDRLEVIGDKQGGTSSRRIAHEPELLDKLRQTVGVPLRIIHVCRNPYDNIATMHTKFPRPRELSRTVDAYFRKCDAVQLTRRLSETDEFIDVRHEDHVVDSPAVLTTLCRFIGVEPHDDFLQACAKIVFESPKQTRTTVEWTPALIDDVHRRMADYPFLAGYTFES